MANTFYQIMIQNYLDALPGATAPARHVEAHMRCRCGGTLDHLSARQFAQAVSMANNDCLVEGPAVNEELAKSYGL